MYQLTKLIEPLIDETSMEDTTKDNSLVTKDPSHPEDDESVEGSGQVSTGEIRGRRSVLSYLFGPSTDSMLRYGKI